MLKPNVEMETSVGRMRQRMGHFNGGGNLLDKIAWIVMKREKVSKNSYYPLPPRK